MTQELPIDRRLKRLAKRNEGTPLSQGEIAREVGCSQQYISKVERRAYAKLRELAWPVWRELKDG